MAKPKKSNGLPPMMPRPVYVEYVAVRRCRFNPSWSAPVEEGHLNLLWDKWKARDPKRSTDRVDMAISTPPRRKRTKNG